MSRLGHKSFFAGAELPIPEDASPGPGWTEQMLEMAAHIGPYRTLQLVECFGGSRIYVPQDPTRAKSYASVVDCIGAAAADKLSKIYGREYLEVPTARYAVARAKRAPLLAEVRAGRVTVSDAARRLKSSRPYVSYLINDTDEGKRRAGSIPLPPPERDPAQIELFGEED